MKSHSVTCHPAEVTFPPLPQPKLVLDLATPIVWELSEVESYIFSIQPVGVRSASWEITCLVEKTAVEYKSFLTHVGRLKYHKNKEMLQPRSNFEI